MSIQAHAAETLIRVTTRRTAYEAEHITTHRAKFAKNLTRIMGSTRRIVSEQGTIAGVPTEQLAPANSSDDFIVYIHGGGFCFGSPTEYRAHLARLAKMCQANVIAVDYRLAPEHPYPAALQDIQAVWQNMLAAGTDPSKVTFMGDSAGGNLALSSCLRFRDQGIAQPHDLVLLSPALDATLSGDSHRDKAAADPLLTKEKMEFFFNAYTQRANKADPLVSPVFADLHGLPSTLVHVGSNEILLSDAETFAAHGERDGAAVSLFIGKDMWHAWHLFADYVPEARVAMQAVAAFVRSQ